MLERSIEGGLLPVLEQEGMGCIVFSPLAQGLLTDKYLAGIPADSRAGKAHGALRPEQVDAAKVAKARRLQEHARARGQSLAQMATAWVLRHPQITSALIGASRVQHVEDAVAALNRCGFTAAELDGIDDILSS